jgi:uncharacterized membrane protein YidH (DUF202 family)
MYCCFLNAFNIRVPEGNMNQGVYYPAYQETYYIAYGVLCAALIVCLAIILHRAGDVFLHDSFPGRPELVKAVGRLLDIGFYLVSFGYVALTFRTFMPLDNIAQITQALSIKVGCFLLLLGAMHFFNLLLLAIFRRRGPATANAVVS